ncbi:carboxymuconolactone decarboxylase family protein [Kordiimonas sp.]|uniref:carboxymuconolactone decarboxylase family protein n=1 Tax=Kordiimonas sp. TaxID=1970157 RepID=UPI003A8CDA1A
MTTTAPVNFYEHGAPIYAAFLAVEAEIAKAGIDESLHHLLLLRASQINGCGFCVKMHTGDARKHGETNERLDRLVVWRHVDDYTPKEKAAFAWVEALTVVDAHQDMGALRAALKKHFTDAEIAAITAISAMINLWNRIQISQH